MGYTPVELRHVRFGRGLLGYRRGAVDRTLAEVVESFEDAWRERAELAERVEQLEGDLVRHRELESLLRTTLVSAEKAAHDLKDTARREAALILEGAQAEAREIARAARAESARLSTEIRRVRTLLAAALATVDEAELAEAEAA
jgi:cell division initiation protein